MGVEGEGDWLCLYITQYRILGRAVKVLVQGRSDMRRGGEDVIVTCRGGGMRGGGGGRVGILGRTVEFLREREC